MDQDSCLINKYQKISHKALSLISLNFWRIHEGNMYYRNSRFWSEIRKSTIQEIKKVNEKEETWSPSRALPTSKFFNRKWQPSHVRSMASKKRIKLIIDIRILQFFHKILGRLQRNKNLRRSETLLHSAFFRTHISSVNPLSPYPSLHGKLPRRDDIPNRHTILVFIKLANQSLRPKPLQNQKNKLVRNFIFLWSGEADHHFGVGEAVRYRGEVWLRVWIGVGDD